MAVITAASAASELEKHINTEQKGITVVLVSGTAKIERLLMGQEPTDNNNWTEFASFTESGSFVLLEMRGLFRAKLSGDAKIDW